MKQIRKSKSKVQIDQLALVVAVFALVGVATLAITQARQGNTTNSTVSIGGNSTCSGTTWTVNAQARANNAALMNVDIYDVLLGDSTTFHLVASDISLPYVNQPPYTFQAHPAAGAKKYDAVVVLHGGSPNNKELLGSFRLSNPCI